MSPHAHAVEPFRCELDVPERVGSRRSGREVATRWVAALSAVTMVCELAAGAWTGSMSLLADGWHMAAHLAAFVLAAFAYALERRLASSPAFAFGTGKVHALAGYTSAMALGLGGLVMVVECLERLVEPGFVRFEEALWVAVVGLIVNLASAAILHVAGSKGSPLHERASHEGQRHEHPSYGDSAHEGHGHEGHGHEGHSHEGHSHEGHSHGTHRPDAHGPHAHDHNFRGVFLHVVADALTSGLAIAALSLGAMFETTVLDPAVALVGAFVVLRWAWGLGRACVRDLLDMTAAQDLAEAIRRGVEGVGDARVADLHVWRLGPAGHGCIVRVVSAGLSDPGLFRRAIEARVHLAHLSVEVHPCGQCAHSPQAAGH